MVHKRTECSALIDNSLAGCVIHTPTKHHMVEWPTHWRDDRKLMERLCKHGVGHPDPDQVSYDLTRGVRDSSLHGCDGCCKEGSNVR